MRSKIFSILLTLAVAVGLTSCHDDHWIPNTSDGEGSLSLSSLNISVKEGETVISRASTDTDNFIVKVYDASGSLYSQWKVAEMPEILTLPVGDYSLTVISHEQEKAAWDAPYYEGSKSFSITDGLITEIGTVTCSFANIKVSIRYSDALAKLLGDDVKVTVICNDEGSLEFTPAETRSGFFQAIPGSSTLVATFEGSVNGHKETLRKTFTDIEAGQHRIITFAVKGGQGEIPDEVGTVATPGITVDATIIDAPISGNIDIDDEILDGKRPTEDPLDPVVPDDPTPSTALTMTPSVPFAPAVNDIVEGASYTVDIHSDNGVTNLMVEIISDYLTYDFLSGVGLSTKFDLADALDAFDKSRDLSEALLGFGFPIKDDLKGKTDVHFDISQLVPLLNLSPDPGNHSFKLTVTDANGVSKTETLIFKVVK